MSIAPSPRDRAAQVLSQMTLSEKVMQVVGTMITAFASPTGIDRATMAATLANGIGHLSGAQTGESSPYDIARSINKVQHYLVNETRLGIPAMVHNEALNGVFAPGFTSFPTPIALAASWDVDAVRRMADIIRRQMRSIGARQALAPVLDVARDARWGRVHETYGEDPYLVSAMGVAYVQGMQGEDLTSGVIATGKHFLGYSMTEGGQNMAATHLGRRELYDVYATPFEAAIHLAGLGSIMNSYSEVDGVPVGASRELLTDLLRGRMGFAGSVVSDYSSVEWLQTRQQAASSLAEAAALALNAGLDVELPSPAAYLQIEAAMQAGLLEEAVLDEAVLRVLTDKFAVGLFDDPYVDENEAIILAGVVEGRDLSATLAQEAVTLVKNTGVLPLSASTPRIAVVGPHADGAIVNFAAYTFPAAIDMFKGLIAGESRMAGVDGMLAGATDGGELPDTIKAILATDSDQIARVGYGATGLWEAIRDAAAASTVQTVPGVGVNADEPQDIEAAVALAAESDVVVLAIGGRAGWYGKNITEGEGTDRARIELAPHQVELARALAATGTPVVAVVYQGRPYGLSEIEPYLDAILIAYYPGPEGARAIASVLLGDVVPTGKLPYSVPHATGQVPIYAGQKHGSGYRRAENENYRDYMDEKSTPLFPFGHGLSYTTFEYGELTTSSTELPADGGSVDVSVTLRNTGERDGTEIVQLYVSDTATGVTRPAIALSGFARVPLAAGETATVSFPVRASQLGYSGVDGCFIVEPGPIDIAIGASSDDIRARTRIEVTGKTTSLEGRRSYLAEPTITRS